MRLGADGKPDPKQPLDAHWVMKASDGHSEPLSEMERKFAYGFTVSQARPGQWTVSLMALRARPFTLLQLSAGWRAVLRVGGVASALDRVFVQATERLDVPEVKWVDLYGTSILDGSSTHERLTPHKKRRRAVSESPF